ncbi:diguanylate cyclase [bacterium]|nr:diguanylate cyclase [bacterium]
MKKFVLLLLLVVAAVSVYAETCTPDGFCFDCYNSSQNLPQNQVVAFAENPAGYMFVAGRNFLARFDGDEFVLPEGGRLAGMPTSTINDFVIDDNGVGFIATDLGLWTVDSGSFEALVFNKVGKVGDVSVKSLTYDRKNDLVYGAVSGKGVFSFSAKGFFEWYNPENSRLGARDAEKVFADSQGTVWLGTKSGVWFLKAGSGKFVQVGYLDDSVAAFAEGHDNIIYAGGGKGYYLIENGEVSISFAGEKVPWPDVTALMTDDSGRLWIGTKNSGLNINEIFSLPVGGAVTAFARDKEGGIWFGTSADGFCIAKKSAYKGMMFADENVPGVVSDAAGNIFFNTNREIFRWKDDDLCDLEDCRELVVQMAGGIDRIFIDKTDNLWVSAPSGLFIMQPDRTFKPLKDIYMASEDIFPVSSDVFYSDSDGNVWTNDLSMPNAVFVFRNDRTAERLVLPADAWIVDIVSHEGEIFVVTRRHGVFKLEKNNSLNHVGLWEKDIFVKRVFVDSKQRIWIVTLSDDIFINIEKDAMAFPLKAFGDSAAIRSVAEDKNGGFWIMTDAGVARIKGEDADCFVSGKCSDVPMVVYGKRDGMTSLECAEGRASSPAVSAFGILFVPMMKGMAVFNTNFKEKEHAVPQVAIDGVFLLDEGGKRYSPDNQGVTVLPHSVKNLSVYYSAPQFSGTGRLLFDHYFDKEYVIGTTERKVVLSNIQSGLHEFSVRAYRSDDPAKFSEKRLAFQVTPEFYEKKGFVTAVPLLAVLLLSIILFLNRRLKAMREAEVKRLIDEKTAELRMKNNTLKEAVMKDPLTGLMNRRYMFEVEERKIRRFIESRERKIHLIDNRNLLEIEKNNDSVYGVIMMDIDHFKRVNDLYGHDAGDVVLKGISEIMQDSVRADDILIRWGGEEFLIVLKNIPVNKMFEIAKKIRKAIETHPFETQNGSTVWVTASMGVVFLPFFSFKPKLLTFENVVTIADMALYYSKENGRDMATFVVPGKNIPKNSEEINGMLSSSEFAVVNGFYTFEKIEPDNFSEFEI